MGIEKPYRSAGYFTWLSFLLDKPANVLEGMIGYQPGALSRGWILLSPRLPIEPANIDLRGSTRWEEGRMPDGRQIGAVIAGRTDVAAAQKKLAAFFDKGLDRRPAKVLPSNESIGYEPARLAGIPQFKLHREIEWDFLVPVGPGGVLRRADVARKLGR